MSAICVIIGCKKEETEDNSPSNRTPGEFTITVAPEENSALISWTAAIDPDGDVVAYTLILEQDTLINDSNILLLQVSDLAFETTYSGSVIASDPAGKKREVLYDFETGIFPNDPPNEFGLVSPVSGAQNVSTSPVLSWENAIDPEGGNVLYDVYIGTSNDPNELFVSDHSNTTFNISTELESETTYYWKVIAKDEFGAERISPIYSFTTQGTVTAILASDEPGFTNRVGHTSLVFNDKMWVIAGGPNTNGSFQDVWSSTDGSVWTEETGAAEFGERKSHASVVFDGKMWLTGGVEFGFSAANERNDVWYSEDGITWTLATDNANFEPRFSHEMAVLNGKMWLFGGRNADNSISPTETWSSSDGVNWVLEADGAVNFNQGQPVVFQDKIWKISGGYNDNVYASSDGISWDLVTEEAPFGSRLRSAITVHNDRLWLISGSDFLINELNEIPDVWYSEDGIEWIQASADAGFTAVAGGRAVSLNDNLYLIAGGGGWQSFFSTNDVYLIQE